jgi:hypothetical protein
LQALKDVNDWKKAEANRALGYTKNSTRTQERRRKEEKGGARMDCISSKGQNIVSIACIDQGGTTDAQKQVKKFSSTKYKSHRCIPENVTCALDG